MVYTLICHAEVKPDCVQKMKEKLIESAAIYEKDTGTISWDVFQDINNPQKFGIVEKFESKDHTKYHLSNPYWATWNPEVEPWLVKPIEMQEYEELLPHK